MRSEIEKNISDVDKVSYDSLGKLEYMNAFLKEVLRVSSPSQEMFLREAIRDHKLGNVNIKKGTLLNVSLAAQCHNPSNFVEPEVFDPKRWMGNSERNLDSFVYIPFFAGSRNCIGQHLALLESRLILVQVVMRYEFGLADPEYKLRMVSKFMYEPMERINMRFSKRA